MSYFILMKCYCTSGLIYSTCCEPFINQNSKPKTALELMRSRYSAYVLANADYIINTTYHKTRKYYTKKQVLKWAQECNWQKLEILYFDEESVDDNKGCIEFKAYFLDSNHKLQCHHEKSSFIKYTNEWFFVDGIVY